MQQKIKIRRGLKENLPTLDTGELAFCTDTYELFVGTSIGNKLIGGSAAGSTITESNNNGYIIVDGSQLKVYDDSFLSLSNLTDVNLNGSTNGYVLTYNSASGQFEPKPVPTGSGSGATNLDGLSDVNVTSTIPENGNILGFQDGQWIPTPITSVGGSSASYIIELNRWNIKQGFPTKPYVDNDYIQADTNIQGINNAIQYAYDNGFTEVILPRGQYALCYPREIKITQSNITFNLNGSTLKVIYDSGRKSPFDTRTTTDYYNFGGNSIVISGASNSHVKNGTIIGCRDDRSFTDVANERKVEWTYGVLFTKGTNNSSVKHCIVSDFMGDNVSFSNTSFQDYEEFSLGLTLNNLDTTTGQPIASTNSVITQMIPLQGNYTSFLVAGTGYGRQTAITGRELGVFFYKSDGTFIRALSNRKIYTPLTIPVGATKFRFVFYNETSTSKNMLIGLKYGLSPHHNMVEHNELYNGHRGGISLGGSYNVIQHNVIRDNGLNLVDGKPVFSDPTRYGINQEDSYGDNCVIRNNVIYNTNHGILAGCYSIEIENNHIYNTTGIGINLYALLASKVKGNFVYNCSTTIGLMSANLENAHVYITQNTLVGGKTDVSTGTGYNVFVKDNTFIDQTSISMPDSILSTFKDNNIKYSTNFSGNPSITINKIENCLFECKTTQRTFTLKSYEIIRSTFTNCNYSASTRNQSTTRETVLINDCIFTNSILENYIINMKQRTVQAIRCKFTDSFIKSIVVSTDNEAPITKLTDCEFYIKTATSIFQTDLNRPTAVVELERCKIEISNSGFLYLIKHIATATSSVYSLSLKRCDITYIGAGKLNLVYYSLLSPMKSFISGTNKFSNINLPVQDSSVYIGYDPLTQSVNEPINGSFLVGQIMANAAPTSGGYLGWVCTTSGIANNIVWGASTVYSVGQQVNTNNKIYECTIAGTSGTTSPSGTGTSIPDGTITWKYVDAKAVFRQYGLIQ